METSAGNRLVAGQRARHLRPRVLGGVGPQLGQTAGRHATRQAGQDRLCRVHLPSRDAVSDREDLGLGRRPRLGAVARAGCEIPLCQIH